MCGPVVQKTPLGGIRVLFETVNPIPNTAPTYNGAPTDNLPVVRLKIGFSTINAMAETVDKKPVFRETFQHRRCLVPVDNFCEWPKTGKESQPYAIALADRSVMAWAGLWETWRSPAAETVCSFTIITTEPNELCARLHNRMPVVLDPTSWPLWLGEEQAKPDELKAMFVPYPSAAMTCWPVSKRVGNVKNNDPSLIEPFALAD